ncbi:MAG: RNA polymerase sigma factor [Bacillota bacterium]
MKELILEEEASQKEGLQYLLYKTYYKDVFRTAYYIVKDKETAKEITHEAYLRSFQRLHTLKDMDKFKAWICTIAANLSKDYIEKYSRINIVEDVETLYPFTSSAEDIVIEQIWKKEVINKVRNLLDEIDPASKEILVLRYYHQLSYEMISSQLSLKLGTVKANIHRAKSKISNLLKKEGDIHGN